MQIYVVLVRYILKYQKKVYFCKQYEKNSFTSNTINEFHQLFTKGWISV